MKRNEITPRDHFFLMYGKSGCNIKEVIEDYKCNVLTNTESDFFKECLKIAKNWEKENYLNGKEL